MVAEEKPQEKLKSDERQENFERGMSKSVMSDYSCYSFEGRHRNCSHTKCKRFNNLIKKT
jgi:hypothetical protein